MTKIGYAAMLEQFHPTDLLDWCAQAEAEGFEAGFMVSEHFHPWTPQQGQSAFAWSFMGALGQRTSLRFGTAVTCPGFRYHPAVIAHAAATLGAMYPGRFYLGLGAGEALNEHLIRAEWPQISVRSSMLFEPIEVHQQAAHRQRWSSTRVSTSRSRAPSSTRAPRSRSRSTSRRAARTTPSGPASRHEGGRPKG
jgi:G6PDH family F420-dependent oxidoreductase